MDHGLSNYRVDPGTSFEKFIISVLTRWSPIDYFPLYIVGPYFPVESCSNRVMIPYKYFVHI